MRVMGFLGFRLRWLLERKGQETEEHEVVFIMFFCRWYNIQPVWRHTVLLGLEFHAEVTFLLEVTASATNEVDLLSIHP